MLEKSSTDNKVWANSDNKQQVKKSKGRNPVYIYSCLFERVDGI